MNQLKVTIDSAIKELANLGRLTEILAAAATVKASVDVLEKSVSNLSKLLAEEPRSKKGKTKPAAAAPVFEQKESSPDKRKTAPARDSVKKRILAKLQKEQRPMSQAELIRVLHHDYYSVSTALAELLSINGIKEKTISLIGSNGKSIKRKVKAYVL